SSPLAQGTNNMLSVIDVENKTIYVERGNGNMLSTGNCVADNGVVAADLDYMAGLPGYFKDGSWYELPTSRHCGFARGITADGSMIVGMEATNYGQGDDGVAYLPVVWHATGQTADALYSQPEVLPHPATDFAGRPPQLISTLAVSADGNTILGDMWDYYGDVAQPIVWTRDANDGWTYKTLFSEWLNPDNVEFPEWPGEAPVSPDYMDYMTPEDAAAYDAALNQWMINGYDPFAYPDPLDYMSDEKKAAYQTDLDTYMAEIPGWNMKYEAFVEVYWKVRSNPNFKYVLRNSCQMNPQGTYFITDWAHSGTRKEGSYKVDMESATYEPFKISFPLRQILEDGTMIGYSPSSLFSGSPDVGYIWPAGGEAMTVYNYIKSVRPEMADWIDSNMTHSYINGNTDSQSSGLFVGVPCATNGLETIATGVFNTWATEMTDDYMEAYSYVFDMNSESGIADIISNATPITVADGTISLGAEVAALEIFDASGVRVFSVKNPSGTVAPGLGKGFYVIRATSPNGVSTVLKARL
ncbi:MAG: T9SS type A sorting domain-containing protein, partial [Muribaculaceae bacterium]|nr:T9SS type A sorting domain-containing protein [Muribaculaceae bacterium]